MQKTLSTFQNAYFTESSTITERVFTLLQLQVYQIVSL